MIIALPNDNRGLLYSLVDLNGQTVHTYRDFDAALKAREGDQRIAIQAEEGDDRWLTDRPAPDREAQINQAQARKEAYDAFSAHIANIKTTEPDAQLEEVQRIRANVDDACRHGLVTKAQWGLLTARLAAAEAEIKPEKESGND